MSAALMTLVDVLGLGADLHDADAGAHRERARAPDEAEIADRLADPLGDARRLLERAALEQHAELIAAEARDGVGGAHARLQEPGHVAQQPVARLVAAGVVHHLELVEVDVEQRVGALAALRRQERRVQPVVELAAVDEPGERIVARLVGERALAGAARCVTSWNTTTAPITRPCAVADRRGGLLDRHLVCRRA